MNRKSTSSTVSAILITVVLVVGLSLAYSSYSLRATKEREVAVEGALRTALNAVEQAIVRAIAEGLNQTVDVGIDAVFEIRDGVLYARYAGVEVSRLLPSLNVTYINSVDAGRLVYVYVLPEVKAIFLSSPKDDVRKYKRELKVVFERGKFDDVKISEDGRTATCSLRSSSIAEVARIPCDLEYWSGATSPPSRPVRLWNARYRGKECIVVSSEGYSAYGYEFYAYIKRKFRGKVEVRGRVAATDSFWRLIPGRRVAFLYVLDASNPSRILARYKISESSTWKPFRVDVRGFTGEFLVAFGRPDWWAMDWKLRVYISEVAVKDEAQTEVKIDELVRLANRGTVPVKVRLKLISGHGLEKLELTLDGVRQILVDREEIVLGEGEWVVVRPRSYLRVGIKYAGRGEFSYRILVEALSIASSRGERLELLLKPLQPPND